MEFGFGSGVLTGLRTDTSGVSTPVLFGTMQSASVEFSSDTKSLWGMEQYPVISARGKTKISAKVKVAQIKGRMYNELFFGQTLTSGQQTFAFRESATLGTGAASYTVANSASTPLSDQGIFFASDQTQLIRVSSSPGSGQYTWDATTGVYAFSTHSAGLGVLANYTYTSTAGWNIAGTNPLMGDTPRFQATFMQKSPSSSKKLVLVLKACITSRFSFPTTVDDFTIQDMDFDAFADDSGNVFNFGTAE
jgi:hypothetical protein